MRVMGLWNPSASSLCFSCSSSRCGGVRVAVTIIFGCRAVPLWLRGLVTLIISGVLAWMLDSQSFGEMMRRTLGLLDVGLIIAMGDGIARATCWIDDQVGYQPTAP